MLKVHRTHRAKILNHSQVAEMLDRHGWSASKLWNVANYHSRQEWNETGEIPDHGDLKDELKTHNNYKGLHSQASQRIRPATARKTTTTMMETAFTRNIRVPP